MSAMSKLRKSTKKIMAKARRERPKPKTQRAPQPPRETTATARFEPAALIHPNPKRDDGLHDYSTIKGISTLFPTIVMERVRMKAEIERLEARVSQLNAQLEEELVASGLEKIGCGDYQVVLCEGRKGASKVDPKALILKGVDPALVAACTTVGKPGNPYVMVKKAGGKDADA